MTDSIGRLPIGRSPMMGKKRKDFLQNTIRKMEQWRDKARINILQQRRRYKQKVENNKALMEAKKAGKLPNLNPSATSIIFGDMPKSRKYGVTHSTVPLRPKYSLVKPRERLYGNKLKALEKRRDAND